MNRGRYLAVLYMETQPQSSTGQLIMEDLTANSQATLPGMDSPALRL